VPGVILYRNFEPSTLNIEPRTKPTLPAAVRSKFKVRGSMFASSWFWLRRALDTAPSLMPFMMPMQGINVAEAAHELSFHPRP
jgi:hypothetical protein